MCTREEYIATYIILSMFSLVSPQFSPQPPPIKYITEGQDLSIPCTAIGPPTPNITWVQIVGNNRVIKSTGKGSATLSIQNIKREQYGTYECQAKNNPHENQPVTAQTVVTVYCKYTYKLCTDNWPEGRGRSGGREVGRLGLRSGRSGGPYIEKVCPYPWRAKSFLNTDQPKLVKMMTIYFTVFFFSLHIVIILQSYVTKGLQSI
jgi:hypothetical protein